MTIKVLKPFNTRVSRFDVGDTIGIEDLSPFTLEHLTKRGFVASPTPKLDEKKRKL